MHIVARPSLISLVTSGSSFKNSLDTYNSASSGQLLNQSSVQQLTSDGNYRHLIRKVSPTGDIHRHICSLSRTKLMNSALMLSIESGIFRSLQIGLTPFTISSLSSGSHRFGISPVFSKLFKFSINDSLMICVSVITNAIPWSSIPADFINTFMNSLNESKLKPFVNSIDRYSIDLMKEDRRMRLYLPEPPTPISII